MCWKQKYNSLMMFNNISALSFDWHGRIHVVVSSWQCLPSWCLHGKATGRDAMRVERFWEVFEREINYEILGWRLGLNSYLGEKPNQSTINISVIQVFLFKSSCLCMSAPNQTEALIGNARKSCKIARACGEICLLAYRQMLLMHLRVNVEQPHGTCH